MTGLLIAGAFVQVGGVHVLSPHELPWVQLSHEDFATRLTRPQMAILHKTLADDREHALAGEPPTRGAGGAEYTAEFWQGDSRSSGAPLITGHDGTTANLGDLVRVCAWHANQANLLSYGHEIKELVGGGYYPAALRAAVAVTARATRTIGIQWQCPHAFTGPLKRFANGGSDLIGIFGHRDVTGARSRWDPGDDVFALLAATHVERFDFDAGQDRDVWRTRQRHLQAQGLYTGALDGLPGPLTTAALAAAGFPDGIFAAWRELKQPPAGWPMLLPG